MGGTQSSETDGLTTMEPNRPKGPPSSPNCTSVTERSSHANKDLETRSLDANAMSGTQSFKTNSGLDNYRPRTAANGDNFDSDDDRTSIDRSSSLDSSSPTSSEYSGESSDDYNKNKHTDKTGMKFIKSKKEFYCCDEGLLYDDRMIRIKFKMKMETPISWSLFIFIMNKTPADISSFNFETFFPEEALELIQDTTYYNTPWWNGGTLRANHEKYLQLEITCLEYFEKQPIFRVEFVINNFSRKIQMNLPIYINKFLAPFKLDKFQFSQKFQDSLVVMKKEAISFQTTKKFVPRLRKYLEDFGFMLHNDLVDWPGTLFVGTGIIHTKSGVYQCLLKVYHGMECKKPLKEYRLMLRTSPRSKRFKSSEYILSILEHEIREAEKSYHYK